MLGISMSSSTSSFSTFGIGTPPIQLIHDSLCSLGDKTSVVAEDPLSSSVVRECMNAMEKVTLKDIGVTRSIVNKVKDPCCMTISENDDFTFAVFFVPAGRTLPTHDHPNMCVLSHVMHGSLRVRSFSPLQDADAGAIANATARHHRETTETHTSKSAPWYLTPSMGNIHEFHNPKRATDADCCVVLEIVMPPYKTPMRPCTYYEVESEGVVARLRPMDPPPPDTSLPFHVRYPGYKPL
jgi:hypothetical protein